MRLHWFLLFATLALLLGPAISLGQFGGPPGGGFSTDPNAMWTNMAGNKDTLTAADVANNPFLARMFDRIAQASGQITKQQFVAYWQQRQQQWTGGRAPGPGGGWPGQPGPAGPGNPLAGGAGVGWGAGPFNLDQMAEMRFGRLDANGDGLLNADEMDDTLRAERDKWDTNHDGFIDLNEFKAYFRAGVRQLQANRQGNPPWGQAPGDASEQRPTVYRAGKLPPGLPSWFAQYDTDGDGQIGLYEWVAAGQPVEQFLALDRNGDGFLTAEEVLRAVQVPQAVGGGSPGVVATGLPTAQEGGAATDGGLLTAERSPRHAGSPERCPPPRFQATTRPAWNAPASRSTACRSATPSATASSFQAGPTLSADRAPFRRLRGATPTIPRWRWGLSRYSSNTAASTRTS
jgi:Ca2+-binding EF-hand superfamily protein